MKYTLSLFLVVVLVVGIFFVGCARKGTSLLDGVRRPITTIVVHHTAGQSSNNIDRVASDISRLHQKRFRTMRKSAGWHIAYHYLITPDGKVWETRSPNDVGHHAGNGTVNRCSLAICLVGDFSKHRPTRAQVQSLDSLVQSLRQERRITAVIPHSYCKATLCCGKYLKREVRKLSWGRHF